MFQALYYIMYSESFKKLKEIEKEQETARADEIKKQIGSSDGGSTNVFTQEEMDRLGIPKTSRPVLDEDDPQNKPPIPKPPSPLNNINTSDLEELLEEEGLI